MKLIPNKPPTPLTDAERQLVNRLTQEATLRRGRLYGTRWKLRKAGIVSAVVRGVVSSSAWGRSMLARRGGQALTRPALDHLRRISPLGVRTRTMNRMTREEQIAFAVAEVERVRRHGTDTG